MELFVVCCDGKPVEQIGNLMFAYKDKKGANKKAAQLQKVEDEWQEHCRIFYIQERKRPQRVFLVEKYVPLCQK